MNRNNDSLNQLKSPGDSPPEKFVPDMLTHLRVAVVATISLAILCSAIYPAIVWGLSQALYANKANGSLITKDGSPTNDDSQAVGSALLGQPFSEAKYFHPRPSAAGNGYDATSSGGSNLGPLSAKLINGTTQPSTQPSDPPTVSFDGIKLRTLLYARDNKIDIVGPTQPLKDFLDAKGNYDQVKLVTAFNDADHPLMFKTASPIPPDAVTASASGLDPHISVENATIQAPRVADARKLPVDKVKLLIADNAEAPSLGILGDPAVNVLKLNLALDNLK